MVQPIVLGTSSAIIDSITLTHKQMTFRVTLDDADNRGKFTFVTIEDCIDMEDCVNHIHTHFPNMIIDVIAEVH